MNTFRHKPMPYGVKLRKMLASQFYLAQADADLARELLESKTIRNERGLVSFIDEHGEWLDG